MRRRDVAVAVAVTGLLLSACGSETKDAVGASPSAEGTPAASAAPTPSATPTAEAAADPASVKANELGKVPVMMYHQIKAPAEGKKIGEYDQTPDEFRAELTRMYDAGFRPVTTRDLIAGKIDIPAGKHPVVLTFDDASASQIQIGADGNPTADSAVGIMEQFEKDHPDWKSTASMYVNTAPKAFLDDKALPWLAANGYEIGAHTVNHANLKQSSDATVQKELGKNVADVLAIVPGYEITTMARPFGIAAVNEALMYAGSFEGQDYKFDGVLLVGSDPSKSPFNAEFDPHYVHRIRSGPKTAPVDTDSTFWLDLFDKGKWSVYTSDGNPDKISYPADSTVKIADKYKDKANPYAESGSSMATSAPTSASTSSPEPTTTSSPEATSTPSS